MRSLNHPIILPSRRRSHGYSPNNSPIPGVFPRERTLPFVLPLTFPKKISTTKTHPLRGRQLLRSTRYCQRTSCSVKTLSWHRPTLAPTGGTTTPHHSLRSGAGQVGACPAPERSDWCRAGGLNCCARPIPSGTEYRVLASTYSCTIVSYYHRRWWA